MTHHFTRWLIGMHRRIDALYRVQAAQGGLLLEQEQQGEQQGGKAASSSAATSEGPAAAASAAAGEGPAAAAATEAAAAAAATGAGEQAADEELEFTQEVQYNPTISDLHMRGLAAVCLAATDVPADVAAAAAACSDSSSGEAAAAAARVAAWVRSERQRLGHRILLVLRHLHKGELLTLSMTNAVLEFIATEAPDAAKAAAQGKPAAAPQQQQQGEEAEVEEAALLSMQQALSLLPHLPLGSLHQLQAFLCLQLCWRGPSIPHIQKLCLVSFWSSSSVFFCLRLLLLFWSASACLCQRCVIPSRCISLQRTVRLPGWQAGGKVAGSPLALLLALIAILLACAPARRALSLPSGLIAPLSTPTHPPVCAPLLCRMAKPSCSLNAWSCAAARPAAARAEQRAGSRTLG